QGDQVLPIEELADMLGTINYELTCVVTKRVPRVFIQGGKVIGVVDHVLHQYK
ncbi:MAG TPA: alanine racemase, partial [Clostridium sp.]|nr:alanine racemase [Clostridium sp.]